MLSLALAYEFTRSIRLKKLSNSIWIRAGLILESTDQYKQLEASCIPNPHRAYIIDSVCHETANKIRKNIMSAEWRSLPNVSVSRLEEIEKEVNDGIYDIL